MICCNPWVQREHDESFDHFTVYYFFCGGDVKYNQWNPVSLERKVEVFSTYKTFREKLLEIRIFALSHPSPRYHNLHFRLHLLLKFPPEKEEKKKWTPGGVSAVGWRQQADEKVMNSDSFSLIPIVWFASWESSVLFYFIFLEPLRTWTAGMCLMAGFW